MVHQQSQRPSFITGRSRRVTNSPCLHETTLTQLTLPCHHALLSHTYTLAAAGNIKLQRAVL